MYVKHSNLFFTAIRISNIITIHTGNQFILAVIDTRIQRIAKPTVFRKSDNIQRFTHLLLLCSNHLV